MKNGLIIDTQRCMGCCACEIACKMENELPAGIRYIVMHQEEDSTPGKEKLVFHFSICSHCQTPACLAVCPTNAIYRDPRGLILVQKEKCIGCKKCKKACPDHIPQFDRENKMQKCSLCINRLDQGMKPSCMLACPAEAISIHKHISSTI